MKTCRRFFSTGFKAKDLIIRPTRQRLEKPDYSKQIIFGSIHTDHILEIDWSIDKGWEAPVISEYHNFSIDPRNSALHYAISLFEGLKAYRNNENVYLFRPELNMARMRKSAQRVCFPDFDGEELIKCLERFLILEKDWIYNKRGYSLYIRPTYISTTDILGVSPPSKAKLFVILSPVGPYFTTIKPLSLICNDDSYLRSFPGGFGQYKLAANYAPTFQKYKQALDSGYNHILWLVNGK